MALSRFGLVRERDHWPGFVLLTCFDGAQTLLVSSARADVDDFAQQRLLPSDQNFFIERSLETLAPVITAKYDRGEAVTHTDRQTGRVTALIELTRDDLEQGLRRPHHIVTTTRPQTTSPTGGATFAGEGTLVVGAPPPPQPGAAFRANSLLGLGGGPLGASPSGASIIDGGGVPPDVPPTGEAPAAPEPSPDGAVPERNPGNIDIFPSTFGDESKFGSPRIERITEAVGSAAREQEPPQNATEQRPAAYRFTLRGEKLDVLPEPPEPEDREFALDTYEEVIAKARELHDRLKRTNSASRVCNSVERLLSALGTQFDDLRPGLLLSRSRSIEADRAAFDTDEARGELFADAFAMMDDTLQSLRDLLAVFPIVRRIEAERLALDLDRNADAIPILREQMEEIRSAAERAEAATDQAIEALAQNDAAIEEATDPVLRTSLVADKLLVVRNFLGAAAGTLAKEMGDLVEKSWAEIKTELPKGIAFAARVAPFMVLLTLTSLLAGPVAGIAAVVPGFKGIASAFNKFAKPEPADMDKANQPAPKPGRKRNRQK